VGLGVALKSNSRYRALTLVPEILFIAGGKSELLGIPTAGVTMSVEMDIPSHPVVTIEQQVLHYQHINKVFMRSMFHGFDLSSEGAYS
jgi:hypothetical protein